MPTLLQEDEIAGPFLQSNTEGFSVGLRTWSQATDAKGEPRCQQLKLRRLIMV
jgi:hypothetical protein